MLGHPGPSSPPHLTPWSPPRSSHFSTSTSAKLDPPAVQPSSPPHLITLLHRSYLRQRRTAGAFISSTPHHASPRGTHGCGPIGRLPSSHPHLVTLLHRAPCSFGTSGFAAFISSASRFSTVMPGRLKKIRHDPSFPPHSFTILHSLRRRQTTLHFLRTRHNSPRVTDVVRPSPFISSTPRHAFPPPSIARQMRVLLMPFSVSTASGDRCGYSSCFSQCRPHR